MLWLWWLRIQSIWLWKTPIPVLRYLYVGWRRLEIPHLQLTVSFCHRCPQSRGSCRHIPKRDPINITNMADTLRPIFPSKSLSGTQDGTEVAPSSVVVVAEPLAAAATWRPTRYANSSRLDMLFFLPPRAQWMWLRSDEQARGADRRMGVVFSVRTRVRRDSKWVYALQKCFLLCWGLSLARWEAARRSAHIREVRCS